MIVIYGECSLGVIAKDLQKIDDLLNKIAAIESGTVEHPPPVKALDTSSVLDFDSETVVPSSGGDTATPPPSKKDCSSEVPISLATKE